MAKLLKTENLFCAVLTTALVLGLAFQQASIVRAAFGDPDTTFGVAQSGKINDVNFLYAAETVALQPVGKILVTGHRSESGKRIMVLRRYYSNGAIDFSFGDSGKAVFYSLKNSYGHPKSILVQDDGKIIVSGSTTITLADGETTIQRGVVWRFNAEGFYDSGWGASGRVLLVGDDANSVAAYYPAGATAQNSFAGITDNPDYRLYRLLPDGSLDTAYGNGDGVKIVSIPNASLIFKNNAVFIAGKNSANNQDVKIVKYNVNGLPWRGFGTQGVFTGNPFNGYGCSGLGENQFSTFAVQSDGKIIAGGYTVNLSHTQVAGLFFRHQTNGAFDPNFNMLPCYELPSTYYVIEKIKTHTDDTIFFRSTTYIFRRTADGTANGRFEPFVYPRDFVIQQDGKILSVGNDGYYVQLSRYLP